MLIVPVGAQVFQWWDCWYVGSKDEIVKKLFFAYIVGKFECKILQTVLEILKGFLHSKFMAGSIAKYVTTYTETFWKMVDVYYNFCCSTEHEGYKEPGAGPCGVVRQCGVSGG